jgi:hypothetical protein
MDYTLIVLSIKSLLTVILPMIPAFVLYKMLPSSAVISGPFKGLNTQLQGAFAGYFIIFIVLAKLIFSFPCYNYEVWNVSGNIKPDNRDKANNKKILEGDISVLPPPSKPDIKNHEFSIDAVVKRDHTGRPLFPSIVFNHEGYAPVTIPLTNDTTSWGNKKYIIKKDSNNKNITIQTPIELEPLSEGEKP